LGSSFKKCEKLHGGDVEKETKLKLKDTYVEIVLFNVSLFVQFKNKNMVIYFENVGILHEPEIDILMI
jgi:hypothetical protein